MFEDITFDICQHFETGRDFGFGSNPNGFSKRTHLSNTQCHAFEDGCKCKRRGKCVLARDSKTWKPLDSKFEGFK